MAISREQPGISSKISELLGEEHSSRGEIIAHSVLLLLLALLLLTARTTEENGVSAQATQDFEPLVVQAFPELFVEIKGEKYSVKIDSFETCGQNGKWCVWVEVPELSGDELYHDFVPISELFVGRD